MTFADHVLRFYSNLQIKTTLPNDVEVMNPYQDVTASKLSKLFYKKYYNDNKERTLIMGINPGRFGGGITGVPFTDPIKLAVNCGIENDLPKKAELSADFIYKMIDAYGGPEKFYEHFYITAVSPLGFTLEGKNLNYYDIKELEQRITDFAVECLQKQMTFGVNRKICFCLGEGENFKFITKLNRMHQFFDTVVPLPHPRFVMQYRRKHLDEFILKYITTLSNS